ncbi:MAG: (Fe-S)-binding protein [Deltaproteobacteria bacterium]|nr:(Fe-S)-binding protein [Deltaproteobacteria bacterium]
MSQGPSAPGTLEATRILTKSLDCVHCGLCLPVCPTYRETGREMSSPRGRVYLARGVAEGSIAFDDVVADEMGLCLGCRACETACPSGVQFGALLDEMRAEVERRGLRGGLAKRIETLALRGIVPHPARLRALVSLLGLAQRLGLDRPLLRLAPAALRERAALLPRVPSKADRAPLPALVPAVGDKRGRVGFFVGCIMPELFGDVSHATVRVLARNGFDVVVAPGQGCCGALHAHAGDSERANELARRNVTAFDAAGVDMVVVDSAGCGAALRDAGRWLPGTGERLAATVRDVSELLDAAGLRSPPGRIDARVCYDDPCHLVHGQGVYEAPRRLLEQIVGVRLVSHEDPTACCGAAGIYNLTHPAMSSAVLGHKMRALAAVDPDVIASGNPGCIMQLRAGVARFGLRAQVVHPVELLDRAYGGPSRAPDAPYL